MLERKRGEEGREERGGERGRGEREGGEREGERTLNEPPDTSSPGHHYLPLGSVEEHSCKTQRGNNEILLMARTHATVHTQ